jgi:hypothetical protein
LRWRELVKELAFIFYFNVGGITLLHLTQIA